MSTSISIPTKTDKCLGAMIATAIGDALGWPNEFRAKNTSKGTKITDYFVEWTRRNSGQYWHYEKILPGEYSDDTQLTLSVARSIIAGNWEEALIKKELPFWLEYERGGGGALLKAARACKNGMMLWQSNYLRDYFNAGANGAAMRILPHVIAAANSTDTDTLITNVIKNSIITHGHPRAILGATCYAYALNYLLRKETVLEYGELVSAVMNAQDIWGAHPSQDALGAWSNVAYHYSGYDYLQVWDTTLSNMVKQLDYIKSSLKKGLMIDDKSVLAKLDFYDSKVNGAGDIAILAAIYLASKYANNPELGIKVPAFSIGADTDTIASITGGLLGMLSGTSWITMEWKMVQDYDCIVKVTELLLSENMKEAAKAIISDAKEQINDWKHTLIGQMRPISNVTLQSGKYATVIISKYQTALGQTMYFKSYNRINNEPRQPVMREQQKIQVPLNDSSSQVSEQKSDASLISIQQIVLNPSEIQALINEPFLKRITFRKVLQIAYALLTSNETSASIANQMEVEQAVAERIKSYIK